MLTAYADVDPPATLEQFLARDVLHGAETVGGLIIFVVDANHRPVPAYGNDRLPLVVAHPDAGARSGQPSIDQQQAHPRFPW